MSILYKFSLLLRIVVPDWLDYSPVPQLNDDLLRFLLRPWRALLWGLSRSQVGFNNNFGREITKTAVFIQRRDANRINRVRV